jgi:hypothetical protein
VSRLIVSLFDSWLSGRDLVVLAVGIVGSGGLTGALIAVLKFRPEAGQVLVTTAQGVLIVQTGVIDSLRDELKRVSDKLEQMEKENAGLRARIRELESKQPGI